MSQRQTEQTLENLYDFLQSYMTTHGYAPSLREMASACFMGRSTVLRYLDKLEGRGQIKRTEGLARSVILVQQEEG